MRASNHACCAASDVRPCTRNTQTKPGERVVLVGSQPFLGGWDPKKGLKLKWHDGHMWKAICQVPVGEDVNFKVRATRVCVCQGCSGG